MAPLLPEIVARLRTFGELDITDEVASKLCTMSAATIDRRLSRDRKRFEFRGCSGTNPGSLLKGQIPMRNWAQWDETVPGFVEIDCIGREGGDPRGDFAQSLTVTEIRTAWTETREVQNNAQK